MEYGNECVYCCRKSLRTWLEISRKDTRIKDLEGGSLKLFENIPGIRLEGLSKTTKMLGQDNR
jgi:hypothetical protein